MRDVFVSYAHEDHVRAQALAQAFEDYGWSVWWDHRTSGGAEFDQVVDQQLDAARCVVVVWSSASTPSKWVRAEAAAADDQAKLLPITFERDLRLPIRFRQLQTTFLTSTTLTEQDPAALRLLADIAGLTGKPPLGIDPDALERAAGGRVSGAKLVTAGKWRITVRVLVVGRARYDLTLQPDGSLSGTGKFAISRADLAGRWSYNPAGQVLNLEMSGGLQEGIKAFPVTIEKWTSADTADCRFEHRRASLERLVP